MFRTHLVLITDIQVCYHACSWLTSVIFTGTHSKYHPYSGLTCIMFTDTQSCYHPAQKSPESGSCAHSLAITLAQWSPESHSHAHTSSRSLLKTDLYHIHIHLDLLRSHTPLLKSHLNSPSQALSLAITCAQNSPMSHSQVPCLAITPAHDLISFTYTLSC